LTHFYNQNFGLGTSLNHNYDPGFYYRAMLAQSTVMRLHVVRPSVRLSVCLSVTLRYRDHIGWNSSKIISRPNSLRPMRSLTPTWAIWCNGNAAKRMKRCTVEHLNFKR